MSQPTVFPVNGTWLPTITSAIDIPSQGLNTAATQTINFVVPYAGRIINAWTCKSAAAGTAANLITLRKGIAGNTVATVAVTQAASAVLYQATNMVSSAPTDAEFAAGQVLSVFINQAAGVAQDAACKLYIQWEQL